MEYVWEGRTRRGTIERGQISAANEAGVRIALRRQQIQAIKIEAKPKDILKSLKFPTRRRVKEKDIVVFTRQFSTMINAGLPLVQCLDILANQMDNAAFKKVVLAIKSKVESGSTFADALKDHPEGILYDVKTDTRATGAALGAWVRVCTVVRGKVGRT